MTHKDEIIKWANCPDGQKVWYKDETMNDWDYTVVAPRWFKDTKYIVDDEWQELRRAQIDGKQLQLKQQLDIEYIDYADENLTPYLMNNTSIDDWRIKPEPAYEYQWVIKYQTGIFALTPEHYTSKEEAIEYRKDTINICSEILNKYEPSKRLRNE